MLGILHALRHQHYERVPLNVCTITTFFSSGPPLRAPDLPLASFALAIRIKWHRR